MNISPKKLLILSVILVLTFAAFSPALRHDFFVLDDSKHLLENEAVRGLDARHLKAMFTSRIQKVYVPLTYLSYALEYRIVQYRPFLYHLNNILLHLGVTALVFVIAGQIGFSTAAAGVAALIFGIHPLHVESVAWITERKDVLYAFFYLLAVFFYLKYLDRKRGAGFLVLSNVMGLLSVLAKPMALSLPLVLLLFDWVKGRTLSLKVFVEKFSYCVLLAPVVWVTYAMHARVPGQGYLRGVLIWVWTFAFYLRKFFVPAALYPSYVLPAPVALSNSSFLLALGICILFWTVLIRWRKNKAVVLAGLTYVFSIFFLLRFDEAWDGNIVADRFMYLPCLGLCYLVGVLVDKGLGRLKQTNRAAGDLVGFALCAVFLGLMFQTFNQTRLWTKDKAIWDLAIRHEPRAFIAYNSRGGFHEEAGQLDLAMADYGRAITHRPTYAQAYLNRGIVFFSLKRFDQALRDFNQAIKIKSSLAEGYPNRGAAYHRLGMREKALIDFEQALRLAPSSPYPFVNRGKLYFELKQYTQALADFSRALELDPAQDKFYVGRGNAYVMTQQLKKAGADFDNAIKINPHNGNAVYNRSIQRYMEKDFQGALDDVNTAQSLGIVVAETYMQDIMNQIKAAEE